MHYHICDLLRGSPAALPYHQVGDFMHLSSLRFLLIDGDGVIWRASEPVPGFDRFFDALKEHNISWVLLTNNNTRTVSDYVEKLKGFGVETGPENIFTSSTATASYLKQKYGEGASVHAVGMSGVVDTLIDAGFDVTTGEEMPSHPVVAVAAGMDRAITYDKIKIAMRLILNGAEFVATNLDSTFPAPDGLAPGTGMIISALQVTTGVQPTAIGKPERAIYDAAMRHMGADPAHTAMIGDRLDTDILGAQRVGISTMLVMTGVTTGETLSTHPVQPDFVFDDIGVLADALLAAQTA
jgi:4-nitrophenyl phosphatase